VFVAKYTEKKKAKIKRWKEKGKVSYSGSDRNFMLGVKSIIRGGIKYIKDFEGNFVPESIKQNYFIKGKQPIINKN
jgi:hypothetical protein